MSTLTEDIWTRVADTYLVERVGVRVSDGPTPEEWLTMIRDDMDARIKLGAPFALMDVRDPDTWWFYWGAANAMPI